MGSLSSLTAFYPSPIQCENSSFDISARVAPTRTRAFCRLLRKAVRDSLASTPCLFVEEKQMEELIDAEKIGCDFYREFIVSIQKLPRARNIVNFLL